MARALSRAVGLALLCGAALPAGADCIIDANGEITNPFAPGCGDVIFTYTVNNNAGTNIALGYAPPVPIASLTPVSGFRDYASLFARHQELLTLNDEVDGEVVGQTISGRDIWAYAIGDADATTPEGFPEGAVLVNGGIHAREWQTPEAATALFEALVEGEDDGGFYQYLVENLNTVVVPVLNVDGFIQTQLYPVNVTADRAQPREGRMRRKNLHNPQTGSAIDSDIGTVADNFWGVDLNRNSDQGFGLQGGSSGSVTSLIYRGSAADSEPETRALQQAATLGPAARLRLYSDTHSFGQVYLAPRPDNARLNAITQTLANRMIAASNRGYGYGPDPAGSPGIGTTADHFAFTYLVPAWTLELEPVNGGQDYGGLASHGHSGFILPAAEAPRMRADVARQYLLGLYRQSGPPAAVAAEIRDTGRRRGRLSRALGPDRRERARAHGRRERGARARRQLPTLGCASTSRCGSGTRPATSSPSPARIAARRLARSGSWSARRPRLSSSTAAPGSARRAVRRTGSCATRTTPSPSTSPCPMPSRSPRLRRRRCRWTSTTSHRWR